MKRATQGAAPIFRSHLASVVDGGSLSAARRRRGLAGLRCVIAPVVEALECRRLLAHIIVNELGDSLTPNGKVNLREAITAAETDTSVDGSVSGFGADTITFDPSLTAAASATITLTNFEPGLGNQEFGPSAFFLASDAPLSKPVGLILTKAVNVGFTNLTLGSFLDGDALNTSAALYVGSIDWGDGTKSAASLLRTGSTAAGSSWNVRGSHKYTAKKPTP